MVAMTLFTKEESVSRRCGVLKDHVWLPCDSSRVTCGMVVDQDVCNSIQALEGLMLNKVNSYHDIVNGNAALCLRNS